jgi:hypothetical protein
MDLARLVPKWHSNVHTVRNGLESIKTISSRVSLVTGPEIRLLHLYISSMYLSDDSGISGPNH